MSVAFSPSSPHAGSGVAVPGGENEQASYPGGKSGAGIYQRLINLIPHHETLIVPFAGRCGVTRRIRAAGHTILIDLDERVLDWWHAWQRKPEGRAVELHHADGIEWVRFRFGLSRYTRDPDALPGVTADDAFIFADPPYVLAERVKQKIYQHEMSDACHQRLVQLATRLAVPMMICGYASPIYASLEPWEIMHHEVPGRRGLRAECVWMNYHAPTRLHDYRYVGDHRRERERIRRRQRNLLSMLDAMVDRERAAMLSAIREEYSDAFSHGGRSTESGARP